MPLSSNANNYPYNYKTNNNKENTKSVEKYDYDKNNRSNYTDDNNECTSSPNNWQRYSVNMSKNRVKAQTTVDWEEEEGGTGGVEAWSSDNTDSQDSRVDYDSSNNDDSKIITNNRKQQKCKTLGIHAV